MELIFFLLIVIFVLPFVVIMGMNRNCPYCNKFIRRGVSRCPYCRTALNEERFEEKATKQGDMKKCPYCAEMVKVEAIKCRYCGEDIELEKQP